MKWIGRALIIIALMAIVSLGWYAAEQAGFSIGSAPSGMAFGEHGPEMGGAIHGERPGHSSGLKQGDQGGNIQQFSFSRLLPGMGSNLVEILIVIAVVIIIWKILTWIGKKVKKTSVKTV